MRAPLEHLLRGVGIVALAVMLWQSLQQPKRVTGRDINERGISAATLTKWSALSKAPTVIHTRLDSVPSPLERDWLAAIAGAGSRMTWSGALPPLMIGAQPVASPAGGTKVLVAAPSGSSIVLSDDVGVIDAVRARSTGAVVVLTSRAQDLAARVEGSSASTSPRDSLVLHRLLVIGSTGWESKFVVAALEQEGWKVDAVIGVAPNVAVTQGATAVIDTSRYSAVVALDGAASSYANRIIQLARMGGGVVLGPGAASLAEMAPLRAGVPGRPASGARAIQPSEVVTLARIPLAPITSLSADAIPLETRGGAIAVATRRVASGRVLQLGYEDTWRWRMAGDDASVRDHALWWTRVVSSVAYAPPSPRLPVAASTDEAPLAGLVASIGPATQSAPFTSGLSSSSDWDALLFVLLAVALIAELSSRRLRGRS